MHTPEMDPLDALRDAMRPHGRRLRQQRALDLAARAGALALPLAAASGRMTPALALAPLALWAGWVALRARPTEERALARWLDDRAGLSAAADTALHLAARGHPAAGPVAADAVDGLDGAPLQALRAPAGLRALGLGAALALGIGLLPGGDAPRATPAAPALADAAPEAPAPAPSGEDTAPPMVAAEADAARPDLDGLEALPPGVTGGPARASGPPGGADRPPPDDAAAASSGAIDAAGQGGGDAAGAAGLAGVQGAAAPITSDEHEASDAEREALREGIAAATEALQSLMERALDAWSPEGARDAERDAPVETLSREEASAAARDAGLFEDQPMGEGAEVSASSDLEGAASVGSQGLSRSGGHAWGVSERDGASMEAYAARKELELDGERQAARARSGEVGEGGPRSLTSGGPGAVQLEESDLDAIQRAIAAEDQHPVMSSILSTYFFEESP